LGSAKQNPTINHQGYDRSMQYRLAKSPDSSIPVFIVTCSVMFTILTGVVGIMLFDSAVDRE
jgi:hypothetical protein